MNFVGIRLASLIFVSLLISIGLVDNSQVFADHFLYKFGSAGSAPGQFGSVQNIVVDSSGNIFVGDGANSRIQKFDSKGQFLLQWEIVNPIGDVNEGNGVPHLAMGINPNGNVYVGTGVNESIIQIFSPEGNFISEWTDPFDGWAYSIHLVPDFHGISGIVFDSNGNIFVANGNHDQISKFSSSGEFLTWWGNDYEEWKSTENGKFGRLLDIATDSSGNVYAIDYDNNRIQKFSNTGQFIKKWGTEGTGDNQFRWPTAISVDSSDFVYVTDSDKIRKFDSDGNFIGSWGASPSTGEDRFRPVWAIFADSNKVYVGNSNPPEIKIFGQEIFVEPSDTDNDGIADNNDDCPTQPETENGYQDSDGCPDKRDGGDNSLWIVIGIIGAAIAGGIGFVVYRKKSSDGTAGSTDTSPMTSSSTDLEKGKKCNVCGTIIPNGQNVCPNCGDTYST